MADLVLPRPAKRLQGGTGFSGKTWNELGLPKRKGWLQCHKVSNGKYALAAFAKGKRGQSHLSRSPDPEVGE